MRFEINENTPKQLSYTFILKTICIQGESKKGE